MSGPLSRRDSVLNLTHATSASYLGSEFNGFLFDDVSFFAGACFGDLMILVIAPLRQPRARLPAAHRDRV